MTDSRSYVDLSIEGPIARITLTNTAWAQGGIAAVSAEVRSPS